MIFQNYNPFGKPKPDPPEEVPLSTFKAAQRAGASHLSKDGKRAYAKRYGKFYLATLSAKGFESWWPLDELPNDAVELP